MDNVWVLPALPAASFVILLLLSPRLPRKGDWLAILLMAATFALVFPVSHDLAVSIGRGDFQGVEVSREWFSIPGYLDIEMGTFVDQITLVMLFVVSFVGLLVLIYSTGYMRGDRRYGWFYAIISLFVASMLT